MSNAAPLAELATRLRTNAAWGMKRDIQTAARAFGRTSVSMLARPAPGRSAEIRNGDDAAAIPDGNEWILLAAEGMHPAFVHKDPYFAGFSSVMVNIGDIAAMGGRPLAVVDVLFDGGSSHTVDLLRGMADAADTFGVPVVGGHTGRIGEGSALAVAIVGKARALITSFDARPGQLVLAAVDLRGRYRDAESLNFDAVSAAPRDRLRRMVALPALLAEEGLVRAGKDISMAGLLGTLVMLLECSGVGARVDIASIPAPAGTEIGSHRWLSAFPSYGFVFTADRQRAPAVIGQFAREGVACAGIGTVVTERTLRIEHAGESVVLWDLGAEELTGFGERTGEGHA